MKQQRAANSRFLFKKEVWPYLNWSLFKDEIDQLILTNPLLFRATNSFYFYFSHSPQENEFFSTPCWVGREIIGYWEPEPESDFGVVDLKQGEVVSFVLDPALALDFCLNDLCKIFGEAQEKLLKEKKIIHSPWKMRVQEFEQGENNFSFQISLEFYLTSPSYLVLGEGPN